MLCVFIHAGESELWGVVYLDFLTKEKKVRKGEGG